MSNVHFGTELELMDKHLSRQDEVFVVSCQNDLHSCFFNAAHRPNLCRLCRTIFKRGIGLVDPDKKIIQLNLDQGRFPYRSFSYKFNNVNELKRFKIKKFALGWLTASTLIPRLNRDHHFDTHKYQKLINDQLAIAFFVYENSLAYLKKIKPQQVYLFNGRYTIEGAIIQACKETNTNYYTHERAGISSRYALRKNAIPHNITVTTKEILAAWRTKDRKKEQVAKNWFVNIRSGYNPGWIAYNKLQTKGLLPKNFSSKKEKCHFFQFHS
jgi:hypothetical protein